MVFGSIPNSVAIAGLEDVIMDVAGGSLGQRLSSRLTGTVSKTATSTTLVGAATLFTTELAVGDAIKVGIEVFTVSAIASTTSLTLDSAADNSESSKVAFKDFSLWGAASGDGAQRVSVNSTGHLVLAGTVPVLRSGVTNSLVRSCPAPSTIAVGAATITAANILSGICSTTSDSDETWTLSTAALLVAAMPGAVIGDCVDFAVISLAALAEDDTITVAAGTGGSLVGFGEVHTRVAHTETAGSIASGLFRVRLTGVAVGSEAYVCYRLA
jgi:hypothetical protein